MTFPIAWLSTLVVFGVLDFIWLSQMGPRLYRPLIGDIMRPDVNWPAAITFYLIYTAGIAYLAVLPALERGDLIRSLIGGAALGLVAYATYDLTNQATLKVWDTRLTIADMAWGTIATALASAAAFSITQRLS